MKHTGLLILLLILASCLPAEQRRDLVETNGTTNTTAGTAGGNTTTSEIGWFQNFASVKRVSFFRTQLDNIYIQGTPVNNFLIRANNPAASYCLEVDMGASIPTSDKRFLRVRAVPISVNTTTGKVRYLRVDFNNSAAAEAVCAKDKVQFVNDTATEFVPFSSTGLTFDLAQICTSCVTTVSSVKLKLFLSESTRLAQINPRELDLSSLIIDVRAGTSGGSGNSCSNSSCTAIGFQCCLDNQCVKDAQVRNGVDTSSPAFLAAEQDRLNSPMAYIRYPQFYYICGTVQPTPGSSGTVSGGTSQDDLLRLQAEYKCVQHLKANSPISPYLQSPYTPTVTDQTVCNTTLSSSPIFVTTVLNNLFNRCATNCKGTTLDERIAGCSFKPDYIGINMDASGNPQAIDCTVLPESGGSDGGSGTGQVSVSSRSVPHRFFNTAGTEVNLSTTVPAGTTQEGTKFFYNDPEKISPNNGTFNMNSILGQMTVELDQAQPATMVKVQIDQLYTINTQDGVYASACLECHRDAWFLRYSPYPTTYRGHGLRGNNYTTIRDAEDGNTGLGNYEDTIFGRACWVPPTMLPFAQPVGASSAESQRLMRLKTQAALWVNGYRRDWYGFNKGALIGSFDGVSWFAIGKGRIIRSTSDRLYLAINAPFGDLTSNSLHTVTVNNYFSGSGAQVDFDPNLAINDPNQNDAATCQAAHQCNVDRDCITRLGWEYVCADVLQQSTYWPSFTPTGAKEDLMPITASAGGIQDILAQDVLPNPEGGSSKRCVYRGAGAVCRTDAGSIPSTELDKRKLLSCAPNFWCADVDGTNNVIPGSATQVKVFNKEIARFARPLEELPLSRNHRLGQDANVLGRPLDYVHSTTGTNSLIRITDGQVISTLNSNVTSMDSSAVNKVGLCRPGKQLPYLDATNTVRAWSPFEQHQALDQYSRTDFISQIGSCPASFQSIYKATSCPVLDDEGNYLNHTAAFNTVTGAQWANASLAQNSCGLETLRTLTAPITLANYPTADAQQVLSPFQLIESKPLNSVIVMEKTLVRDACLRKAGAVCHSDLDCSPNKLHTAQLETFNDNFFGNTPNRRYYEEYLVCGQETAKPAVGSPEFNDYDMTLNRCCREVGQSLSTYSANEPTGTGNSEDSTETATLDPFTTGAEFPTDPSRYERFASLVDPSSTLPALNAYDERDGSGALGTVLFGSSVTGVNVRTARQWQTLNNANVKTCCGGGWMRKFADGSTTWPIGKRLNLNVSNFRCLNYISPLIDAVDPTIWGVTQGQLDIDQGRYCSDVTGATGNCAQLSIQMENNLSASPSCATRSVGSFGTLPTSFSTLPGEVAWSNNIFAFFAPSTGDEDVSTFMDFSNGSGRRNVTIFLPSYVGAGLTAVSMQRRNTSNVASEITCTNVGVGNTLITSATDPGVCAGGGTNCCYEYNSATRLLKVTFDQSAPHSFWDGATPSNSGRYGARVTFNPPGADGSANPQAKIACKDYYYLDLLGRFELAGIPQITHPRILCNNNGERVVPGLFSIPDSNTSKTAFDQNTFSFVDAASTDRHTNYQGLENAAVFDPHEFKCCTPLGRLTKTPSTCCSGLGVEFQDPSLPPNQGTPNYKCMLPSGTNLNVYFNRFVSSEATNPNLPNGITFATADFSAQTGELLINTTNNAKLATIGNALCNSTETNKVRRGGAFGNFRPEPLAAANTTQTIYGIVDSVDDSGNQPSGGETLDVGFAAFDRGYRWNHHTYCK